MKKRIYVGNLNPEVKDKDLKELFSEFGEVIYAKVSTRPEKRSRGFGFVEMAEENQARKAIEKLNQTTLMDRKIVVNEAKERIGRVL